MRTIREYRHRARKCHPCDRCFHDILPNQEYEGIVCAVGRHIIVLKFHANPCCDWPPDPDEALHEYENLLEYDELPMAA